MKITNKLVALTMCLLSLTAAGCGKDKGVDLQILMTSDTHGFLVPFDYALDASATGSLSQVATAIKQLRNDNTLVIDCGDAIQGNSADLFLEEDTHPMIEALNKMNYDVFVPGNHEFNYGVPYLTKQLGKFKGKVLCGNVFKKDTYEPLADSFKVFTKGGVRVAVIGMDTHLITKWDGDKLKEYTVTNPILETKNIVKTIKDNNLADVIVAAEHIGFPKENGEAGTSAKELAEVCPDIDVILASHEHKAQMETVNGVLIVENKSNAQTMMKVDLNVKKKGGKYKVDTKTSKQLEVKDYKTDDEMDKFAEPYDTRAKTDARTEIGTLTGGPLAREYEIKSVPSTFLEPTPLVNFVNTVQKEIAKANIPPEYSSYTDVKISSTAIGNYDANLKNGAIRKCDVSHIYKYTNTLYILEMSGKQLKEYLEWSAKFYNQFNTTKKDLTISFNKDIPTFNYDMMLGVYYDINIDKEPGSRIENLRWNATKGSGTVDQTEKFLIAVNNYRANTHLLTPGSIYATQADCPKLVAGDLLSGEGIREMITKYIKETLSGTLDGTQYGTKYWEVTHTAWNETNRETAINMVNANPSLIGERNSISINEGDL